MKKLNVRADVKNYGNKYDIVFTYRNDVSHGFQYIEEIQDESLRYAACNFAHKVPCGVPADEMNKAVYFKTNTGNFSMGKDIADLLTCTAGITRYLALENTEVEDAIIKCNVAANAIQATFEVNGFNKN